MSGTELGIGIQWLILYYLYSVTGVASENNGHVTSEYMVLWEHSPGFGWSVIGSQTSWDAVTLAVGKEDCKS